MYKLDKPIRKRLDKVMDALYPDGHGSNYGIPKKEFRNVSAPAGSLIIVRQTMPKKDFQFILVRWMDLMEKRIKSRKANKKRKRNK